MVIFDKWLMDFDKLLGFRVLCEWLFGWSKHMNMELINIVNVQSEKYGCGKLIIFHIDTCRLLYMASG